VADQSRGGGGGAGRRARDHDRERGRSRDREADIYDLFLAQRPAGVDLLVCAQHDRWVRVATDEQRHIHVLRATLAAAPVAGERTVAVPRRPGHPARVATRAVRFQQVTLTPPPVLGRRSLPPVPLWALRATEEDPPTDVEPWTSCS